MDSEAYGQGHGPWNRTSRGWVADRLAIEGHDVIGVDTSASALEERTSQVFCIHGPAGIDLLVDHEPDVIVNALPGRIGDQIRSDLITQGLAVADLAFTAEDPREHNELAIDLEHVSSTVYESHQLPPICCSLKVIVVMDD